MVCVVLSVDTGELPTNGTNTAVTTPGPTHQPHSCPAREFVCGAHGECVPLSKVCDFRHDCSDGSDEINCGKKVFLCIHLHACLCVRVLYFVVSYILPHSVPLLSPVKAVCDFEGGDTCGWKLLEPSLVPIHVFRWAPDQGETIHDGEQYHRPVNDHTL